MQRYILGLSLVAITYFDGTTMNLRQGCQLVAEKDQTPQRKCINADGSDSDFVIDKSSALSYAARVANDFGVGEDRVDAVFDPKAAKADRKAGKKKRKEEAGE